MQVTGEPAHRPKPHRVPVLPSPGERRPCDRVLDGDLIGAARVEVIEELAQKPLGVLKAIAERSTHGEIFGHRLAQGAHRTAPGHGRAIFLSASRSTFA
jgi:hypothetical protein